MARLMVLAVLTLLLSGCSSYRWYGAPPDETKVLGYVYIPSDPRPAPPPLYCYSTIAMPDCYASPVAGRYLVGHFGPTPPIDGTAPMADATSASAQSGDSRTAAAPEAQAAPTAAVVPVERATIDPVPPVPPGTSAGTPTRLTP